MCAKRVPGAEPKSLLPKLRFHFIKANGHRSVHLDGVYGGIGPRGTIQMNFFSERIPIPQTIVHYFNPEDGSLGDEISEEQESKDGIVREVEFSASMELQTARSLVTWLNEKIAILEKTEQPDKP